jgi:hypothetical protein
LNKIKVYINYGIICLLITSILVLDIEFLNIFIGIYVIYLIQTKTEDNFFLALIIALTSINSPMGNNEIVSEDVIMAKMNYSVNLGFLNITIPEIFFLSIIFYSLKIVSFKKLNEWRLLILLVLIGGILCSYFTISSTTYGKITTWSGGVRITLVPLAIIGGIYINKYFEKISIIKLLAVIIMTYLINVVFFHRSGHIIFITAACIGMLIFISKQIFCLFTAIFFIVLSAFESGVTFTVLASYLIPVFIYLNMNNKKLISPRAPFKRLVLFFGALFVYLLVNLESIFNYFLVNDLIRDGITLNFETTVNYFIYKIGDRIIFWIPFIKDLFEHPFQMVFNKPIDYIDPINNASRELTWNTHPHNTFISLLSYYGIIFGSIIIIFIIKVMYKSLSKLTIKNDLYTTVLNVFIFSMIPGLLFGFYPVEFNIGYLYFLIAGVIIFKNENTTYRIR